MNPLKSKPFAGLLLVAAGLMLGGCNSSGAGETVPSPPRELVEKSFHPPAGGSRPDGPAAGSSAQPGAPGK